MRIPSAELTSLSSTSDLIDNVVTSVAASLVRYKADKMAANDKKREERRWRLSGAQRCEMSPLAQT